MVEEVDYKEKNELCQFTNMSVSIVEKYQRF